MTPYAIARERLARQHLLSRPFRSAAQVVSALGAVQAQEYAGAKWAIALRMRKPAESAIERAMTEGAIIRTHVLRPTWHLVAREDVRWMLALTGPRVSKAMAPYNVKLELDARVFAKSQRIIRKALAGGRQLTRQELAAAMRAGGLDPGNVQRLAHIVMQAELDMVVCSGALRGKQFTYALMDERVPASEPVDRDEAILRLARLYFASRSPATARDFSWWSGLKMPDAKRGMEMAGVSAVGEGLWSLRAGRPRGGGGKSGALLLPNYDEYFIGHTDRSAIGERLRQSGSRLPQGSLFWNVVVLDGQIVGGWRRVPRAKGLRLEVRLVTKVKTSERASVVRAAESYADFLRVATEIRVS